MPRLKPWEWVVLAAGVAFVVWWYRRRLPATIVSTGLPATSVPVVPIAAPPPAAIVPLAPTQSEVQPTAPLVAAAPAPAPPLPQPPPTIYVTPVSQGGLDPRFGNAGDNIII